MKLPGSWTEYLDDLRGDARRMAKKKGRGRRQRKPTHLDWLHERRRELQDRLDFVRERRVWFWQFKRKRQKAAMVADIEGELETLEGEIAMFTASAPYRRVNAGITSTPARGRLIDATERRVDKLDR